MTARRKWDVFISYSRSDRRRVRPLVDLLRGGGLTAFRDEDSITAGTPWEAALDQSIESARTVFVFWSEAAADSKAVQREYRRAIKLKKKVVPVLLDDTRLPPSLRRLQWIDLRDLMTLGTQRTIAAIANSGAAVATAFLIHRYLLTDLVDGPQTLTDLASLPPMFSESERAAVLEMFHSMANSGNR